MKPLDPRLLTEVRAARRSIIFSAVTGFAQAALIVAQAILIAHAITPVITSGASFSSRIPTLQALGAVILARVLLTFVHDRFAHRSADRVVAELRSKVFAHVVARGPRATVAPGADVVTLATQGLEDLRPYFVNYVPQLLLAVTVTPATLLVVFFYDWVAGLTILFTIPLIPVFMALVGWMTQSYSTTKLARMRSLNAEVIDLLAGLPTLRGFGRELGPITRVKVLAATYTKVTMQTLRVAFLSGAVLEFLTTLSVALVAVGVGMRLVSGLMTLLPGLVVIMLAPECFQPLRQVGAHFHDSADGVAAADATLDLLATPVPSEGSISAPEPSAPGAAATLTFENLTVRAPGRALEAPAALSGMARPGAITALVGESGAGKTTAVMAALGVIEPSSGRVALSFSDGTARAVHELTWESWHRWCTWVPQRPTIAPGTILDQFSEAGEHASAQLRAAAQTTGFADVVAELPEGWLTRVGHGGLGLSVGQRQRLALTRALAEPTPVMIFDEPSAHLDAASEQAVLRTLMSLRERGATVLVVAHRPALMALADERLEVRSLQAVSA
ncbi:MAG: thiol reductant ABC exporter subunit CydD [Bowdeniella nasicola]|nr:thiol reductant ABC exporter subunit CydD [Bowdeniella nasicola]